MYSFSKPNLITEEFLLPSSDRLYGSNFDGNVTLRAMTTLEERMRVGAQSFYPIMVSIVNECIVDNKNPDGTYKLDSSAFTLFDFDAICVKLRIMSYGPEYKTYARCPICGEIFKYTADLRECEFSFLPDDFSEPYDIGPLPHSGDTLGCRFLRVKDRIDIDKKAQEILSKNPKYLGRPEYTLEMERRIMTVNGDSIDPIIVSKYVENMISMDSDYYHQFIDKDYYGVIRVGTTPCQNEGCSGHAIYTVKSDSEFFRSGRDYQQQTL